MSFQEIKAFGTTFDVPAESVCDDYRSFGCAATVVGADVTTAPGEPPISETAEQLINRGVPAGSRCVACIANRALKHLEQQ